MPNKKRKCAHCKEYGLVSDGIVINNRYYCSEDHIVKHSIQGIPKVKQQKAKQQRKESHKRKQENKGLTYWIKQTKLVMQEYAALRDQGKACISCNTYLIEQNDDWVTRWDGGHYNPVGSHPEMQLLLWNINGQCRACNSFKGGMKEEQTRGIEQRYGVKRVEYLRKPYSHHHWDLDYLARMRRIFRKRMKRYRRAD